MALVRCSLGCFPSTPFLCLSLCYIAHAARKQLPFVTSLYALPIVSGCRLRGEHFGSSNWVLAAAKGIHPKFIPEAVVHCRVCIINVFVLECSHLGLYMRFVLVLIMDSK